MIWILASLFLEHSVYQQGWTMQDWKMMDNITGVEIAGMDDDRLEFGGLEDDGVENGGLENDWL